MPKIKYQAIKLKPESLTRIQQANTIIQEYAAQDLDLTLRQLFYQFVSRALIPNNDREYKKLGDVISSGRMAGLIDWEAIVDRTRYVRDLAHWSSPQAVVEACASQFRLDKWQGQPYYLEVWIEKDALIGVIEAVCRQNDMPYLACRGYSSASEVWKAGHERIKPRLQKGKKVRVLYLGDHDPSGIDMTRDIRERLSTFTGFAIGNRLGVERLALNMDQINAYNPPPNPTKLSDSRASGYIEQYGHECWELDALDPVVIRDLIQASVDQYRDQDLWQAAVAEEQQAKSHLAGVAANWEDVVDHLADAGNGTGDDGDVPNIFEDID